LHFLDVVLTRRKVFLFLSSELVIKSQTCAVVIEEVP
jgi:hypothetical protein